MTVFHLILSCCISLFLFPNLSLCGLRNSKLDFLPARQNDASSSIRDGKLFPFLTLVTFGQTTCKSDSGDTGVCVKKSKCTSLGGTNSGTCAQTFGVCCVVTAQCTGGVSTVSTNGTTLVPGPNYNDYCRYEIPKSDGVCQIRLDFDTFQIEESMEDTEIFGNCVVDTLTISGQSNAMLGPLCGDLSGQHMYLDYGSNSNINLDIYLGSQTNQNWKILVTMIKCNSPDAAPSGCLQYFTEQRNRVMSLNYNKLHQLNNQDYSVCVRSNPGMSKITWKSCGGAQDFVITADVETLTPETGQFSGNDCISDWVMVFGDNKYCGVAFPDAGAISTTQPFMMQVHMNDVELPFPPPDAGCTQQTCDFMNTGFCLMYSQTPN